MAHELDIPAIQKATGYDVEHVVKGGERLPDYGGIKVLHTPGHTAGHISLHLPRIKTMIAGDAIVSAGSIWWSRRLIFPPIRRQRTNP